MSRFHAFVKEKKSIPFPEETFDPGGRPSTEKEQSVGHKQMHMEFSLDDGSQRIDPEAEVRISADDVNAGKGTGIGIFKHGTPP